MFPNYSMGSGYGLPIPYQMPIAPPISNGAQIHISGTPTGDRFEVNLKSHQDDFVLHFNPRLNDNAIVLNSAQRGSWGQEQRQPLVLQRGVRFVMVIMVTDRGFNVALNNAHFCEFPYRLPMHLAQSLEIKGDLTLESAQIYPGSMGMPGGFPPMGMGAPFGQVPQPPFGGGMNAGFGFPSAPFAPPPPSGFPTGGGVPSIQSCRINVGSRIFVRGFIPPGASRFELNLLQGYNDGDDIAFHFNPRFDVRTIVKNHRRGGQWGQEENQPFPQFMPLMPGMQIDLQITCNPDKYTIFMNNQLIAEYYHKIPPGYVMAIQYKGDLNVSSIGQM